MTIEQLHGFYVTTLKNRGSKPDASLQRSIGQRIKLKELEDELGTPLVDPRNPDGTALTLAGRIVFQYGKALFENQAETKKVRILF